MQCVCRLAAVDDLETLLEAFHQYNEDEALARHLKLDVRGSESFTKSITSLIENKNIMVACGVEDNEVYGLSIFYEKTGLDAATIKTTDGLQEVEMDAIASCRELGLDFFAPIFSVCNACMGVQTLGSQKFVYLEGLGVKQKYRGKGIATLLVKELETMMKAANQPLLLSVATSIGTCKILDKLGWEEYNATNTAAFPFKGEHVFSTLDLDIKAYRKYI